jgi:protein TonB
MPSWWAKRSCARPILALNYDDCLPKMKTTARTAALSIIVLASMCGCGAQLIAAHLLHPGSSPSPSTTPSTTIAPAVPRSPALDAYKTEVALHVVRQNPNYTFSGRLPEMLPAIVVLSITVDKDGKVTHVAVQRSRDPDASQVAVASMWRSGDLPKPDRLLANNTDFSVTFSETFLFNDEYRFQLRSLAGPQ